MNSFIALKRGLALATLLVCGFGATLARANLSYLVNINTAPLVGSAIEPVGLDLQSFFGSGSAQTITISNFTLLGGALEGAPELVGAVAGSLGSTVTFNPSGASPYNDFFQQLGVGVTGLQFVVDFTTNAAGDTPTSFAVSLFDVQTNGVGNSLVLFNIDGSNTNFQTAGSVGVLGVTATVSPIPEPSTYALLMGGVCFAGIVRARRNRRLALQAAS